MAVKKKEVKETRKPVEVTAPKQLEVVSGNTGVLTVQFLAAINRQLGQIIALLEKK